MSVYIPFIRVVVSELCNPGVFMMNDENPYAGPGSGSNPYGGTGSGSTSGIGRGSASGNGRGSMAISDICNPPGPDTESDVKIRPIAERPTKITYDSKNKPIHPYETTAEKKWDAASPPDTRNKDVGRLPIYDPKNQNFDYKQGETNQPLAGSTATSLEDLRKKGFRLHEYALDAKQNEYFRKFLQHEDRETYDKIYTNKRGRPLAKPN